MSKQVYIKKVADTPIKDDGGRIVDSKETSDDKQTNTYSARVIDESVKEVTDEVSDLSQNLTELETATNNINVYVSEDGKLHFVDGAGADSELPFNVNKLTKISQSHNTLVDARKITIDVTSYPNFQDLTLSNIIVETLKTVSGGSNTCNHTVTYNNGVISVETELNRFGNANNIQVYIFEGIMIELD